LLGRIKKANLEEISLGQERVIRELIVQQEKDVSNNHTMKKEEFREGTKGSVEWRSRLGRCQESSLRGTEKAC